MIDASVNIPTSNPDFSSSQEILNDGQPVTIRLMTARDGPAEREFISGLSPESRRMRFLGQIGRPSDAMIAWLTAIDFVHDLAFVAVVREDGHERIVGVSRYGLDPHGGRCECAVVVADDWQGKGLGVRLMQHLIDVARARGIELMYSLDAASNLAMKDLARFLGFTRRPDPEDATLVIHELQLQPQPR